eukprot:12783312-Alexandrium_andersonii.AAC.1
MTLRIETLEGCGVAMLVVPAQAARRVLPVSVVPAQTARRVLPGVSKPLPASRRPVLASKGILGCARRGSGPLRAPGLRTGR